MVSVFITVKMGRKRERVKTSKRVRITVEKLD